MRTKHMKRAISKRHRSLRKKTRGGGFLDWFNSSADNNESWHAKLTNLFSSASAPPVPDTVAKPPQPQPQPQGQAQAQAQAPVPPTAPWNQPQTQTQTGTGKQAQIAAGNQEQTQTGNQQQIAAPVAAPETAESLVAPAAGGKRTRKRRHPKKKRNRN